MILGYKKDKIKLHKKIKQSCKLRSVWPDKNLYWCSNKLNSCIYCRYDKCPLIKDVLIWNIPLHQQQIKHK